MQHQFDQQTKTLRRVENRVAELEAERRSIATELTEFEQDLQAQRRENEAFGEDLKLLREEQAEADSRRVAEVAQAEKEGRLAQARAASLQRELEDVREAYAKLQSWETGHECGS